MITLRSLTAAAVTAVTTVSAAHAVTFEGTFTVGGDALSDLGLVVQVSPNPGPVSFDLEVGNSVTFDLFDIWTDENSLAFGEDTVDQDIFVAFDFTAPPPPFGGTVSGETDGVFFGFFLFQQGEVTWDGTETVSFGALGDGVLELSLSDETFNTGFLGLNEGSASGATVQLTATYVTEPSVVPLPASAFLLLAGIGGLGVARRFRKT